MNELLSTRINGGNAAYGRKESDFYPTPSEVTEALLLSPAAHLFFGATVWEPACGEGHMAKVLEAHQPEVVSTDLASICYGEGERDFLAEPIRLADWIITNPPFCLSEQFIEKAISLGGNFAFLLKSQYWHAARRLRLFSKFPPAYILPLTWRPDFLFKTRGGSPLMDCIWCVWTDGKSETLFAPLPKPLEGGR